MLQERMWRGGERGRKDAFFWETGVEGLESRDGGSPLV